MKEEALQFIKSHAECVLATASPEGQPEAAVVLFSVDNDFKFYFGTRKEYRKYGNLLKNNKTAVVVGTSGKDPRTVQIEGVMEILENPEDIEKARQILRQNLAMIPFLEMPLVLMRLNPTWARYLDGTKGPENFQQIIP